MGDTDALRDKIAQAIAEKFTSPTRSVMRNGKRYDPETFEDYTEPVPMEERINQGAWEIFTDSDGQRSIRPASGYEVADAVLPVVTQEVEALQDKLAHALVHWNDLLKATDSMMTERDAAQSSLASLRDAVAQLADQLDEAVQTIPTFDAASLGRRGGLRDAARLVRSLSDNKEQRQ